MHDWLDKLEASRLTFNKTLTFDSISTSYIQLDHRLGVNGIPKGKIVEIAGHSGSCKSTLALDIISEAQQHGSLVMYVDLDCKFDKEWSKQRLVNNDELLLVQNKPWTELKYLVGYNLIDVIVIDSISNIQSDEVTELLQFLAKTIVEQKITGILLSQIRNSFCDPRDYNTPYMKLLNQHCNVRMMMTKKESIKHAGVLIGKVVNVDIYKNSLYRPQQAEIEVYF